MEWTEVAARVAAGEDEHTEFKRAADLRPLGPAIAAMANGGGGLIVLGVTDDGAVEGVREPAERVAERLTDFVQTGFNAPVMASFGRVRLAGEAWVHWIVVPRQRGFEPIQFRGRVYVRRGRSSAAPGPQELQELYNRYGYVVTEEQLVHGTGAADIEWSAFERFTGRLGLDLAGEPLLPREVDLLNRGVLAEGDQGLAATVYGLLAFGRDPQRHHQTGNFWVECVAYGGVDRADEVLGAAEARGRCAEQVDRALMWLRAFGKTESYEEVIRHDRWLVPLDAVREAVVNAVCHRDYAITGSRCLVEVFSDRVVVTSPGALPNHMTPEMAQSGGRPRSRNELVAHYMLTMGYMEGRGRGWPRIRRVMREYNGLTPRLEEDRVSRWVRVVLPLAPSGELAS